MATPALRAAERVLVRESAPDGSEYVGTDHALYHRAITRPSHGWRRVAWAEVAAVGWSRTSSTVTLRMWPETVPESLTLRVRNRSRLPAFLSERVTACRVVHRRVAVTADCEATVTAHRTSAEHLQWTVRLDARCDRQDPAVGTAIDAAVDELRTQLGC